MCSSTGKWVEKKGVDHHQQAHVLISKRGPGSQADPTRSMLFKLDSDSVWYPLKVIIRFEIRILLKVTFSAGSLSCSLHLTVIEGKYPGRRQCNGSS
jgi:hypothetical protein